MEDDHTRIAWFALLAMADRNGEVQASIPGLANIARIPVESARAAILKFLSPDPDSRTKDDEGRRIQEIKGGWLLINHAEYRQLASDLDRKQKAAERQQRVRDKITRNASVTPQSRQISEDHASVTEESHQIPQAEAEAEANSQTTTPKVKRMPSKLALLPEGFGRFWEVYPKKVAKSQAANAWKKVSQHPDEIDRIIADIEKRKTSPEWMKDGGQFIPYPASYLNARRWEDIIDTVETKEALGERLRSMRGYPSHIQHCYVTEAEKAEYAVLLAKYRAMPE